MSKQRTEKLTLFAYPDGVTWIVEAEFNGVRDTILGVVAGSQEEACEIVGQAFEDEFTAMGATIVSRETIEE